MMSYLDWIRQKVGHQKIIMVYTSACVRRQNGDVLWQQRTDFNSWGLPGGILELDETLPQCVIREVKEETGLNTTPTKVIGVYSSPDFDVVYPNGDQVQQVTFCFECFTADDTLHVDGRETQNAAWFPTYASPPTFPWYQAMLDDLTANRAGAAFQHGRQGYGRNSQPYYQFIRHYIGQARYISAGAVAFVQNQEGHILLQQRGDNGLWGFPGGGVELGERVDQTVINEVREETGLEVEPVRIIGVYSNPIDNITYPNGNPVKLVRTFFECRIRSGRLQADGVESLAVDFFSPEALPALLPQHVRPLQDALANQPETLF